MIGDVNTDIERQAVGILDASNLAQPQIYEPVDRRLAVIDGECARSHDKGIRNA